MTRCLLLTFAINAALVACFGWLVWLAVCAVCGLLLALMLALSTNENPPIFNLQPSPYWRKTDERL